jgi:hypothetical protein
MTSDDESEGCLVIDMEHQQTDDEGFTVKTNKNSMKRLAESPSADTEGKKSRKESDNADFVVYLKGKSTNLALVAPARIRSAVQNNFGKTLKIERAGPSIRVHCRSMEQKTNMLKATLLGDTQVEVTEPRSRTRTEYLKNLSKKCVIMGVPMDVSNEEICEAAEASHAMCILKRDTQGE